VSTFEKLCKGRSKRNVEKWKPSWIKFEIEITCKNERRWVLVAHTTTKNLINCCVGFHF
jgi:hypothetical protein